MDEHDYKLLGAFVLDKQSKDKNLKEHIQQNLPNELNPYFITPKGIVRVEQRHGEYTIKITKGIENSVRVEIWQGKEAMISADFLCGSLTMEKTWNKGSLPIQRSSNMIVSDRDSVQIITWTKEVTSAKTREWIGHIKGFFQDSADVVASYHK